MNEEERQQPLEGAEPEECQIQPMNLTSEEIQQLADAVSKSLMLCHKEVLTIDEAALYTGLSKNYLYKLTSGRMVPHSKPAGRNCFFRRRDLEDWMMHSPVPTKGDISAAAMGYCMRNPLTPTGRPIKKKK